MYYTIQPIKKLQFDAYIQKVVKTSLHSLSAHSCLLSVLPQQETLDSAVPSLRGYSILVTLGLCGCFLLSGDLTNLSFDDFVDV